MGDASRQLLQLISPPTIPECCVSTNEDDTVYKENNHVNCASVVDWEARDRLLTLTKVSYLCKSFLINCIQYVLKHRKII